MKNFTVYKSSAGSGKTYTLVREYISLALTSPSYFRHILAITFTNKAANEMKQRVLQSLHFLSSPQDFRDTSVVKFMWTELVEKTGYTHEEVVSRASEVLSAVTHHYDDFAIRTIDSFVSGIIRTFAHDLKLPADFTVEMDKDVLLDEAIDQLIRKAGIDPEITRILVEFTESKADEEKSWQIENDFKKAGSFLFSEEAFQFIDKIGRITPSLIISVVRQIKVSQEKFEKSVVNEASKAKQLMIQHGIEPESFYYGKQGIGTYFYQLSAGIMELPNKRVTSTIDEGNWTAAKADPSQKVWIEQLKSEFAAIFHNCMLLLDEGLNSYQLLSMVKRHIYQLGVLGELNAVLEKIKKENRILHISEFNKYITDIILREPVPFIYERTGERYRNYLLDEFQDTSELQWKNLLPLISDSLAYGRFNLVVGDGKQAIYRFRNGQVEQFMLLPALPGNFDPLVFPDAEAALKTNYQEEILDTNFRSSSSIIEFNNEFFRFASERLHPAYQDIYLNLEQKPVPGNKGGWVQIDFIEDTSAAGYLDSTLIKINDILSECRELGYEWRNIVILTRSNIQGNQVARFLIGQGIGVVSAEALLLAASAEINLIISALAYLQDSNDRIAAAAILIHLGNLGILPVQTENIGKIVIEGSLLTFLQEGGIDFNPSTLRRLTLYDLCEEMVRLFRLDTQEYNAYIQFFLEFVSNHVSGKIFQLRDLLDLWEEKKDKLSVVVPEGVNSVRIMTVHKAKGLEFPVVILPFAYESMRNTKEQIWIEPDHEALQHLPIAMLDLGRNLEGTRFANLFEMERNKSFLDLLNLAYVAFTRPIDQLYIITKESGHTKSDSISLRSLIRDYLNTSHINWSVQGRSYSFGEKSLRPGSMIEEGCSLFVGRKTKGWQDRISIAKHAPHKWNALEDEQPYEWGTLVHDTLSGIEVKASAMECINRSVERFQLDDEDAKRLEEQVLRVVNHEMLSEIFEGSGIVLSESEILLPEGKVLRPDRVVVLSNKVIVVEFKTGQQKPEHFTQLDTYVAALAGMQHLPVIKLLIYIDDQITIFQH